MKKFSKIFLVLLTLSLVFGAMFSVVSSAAAGESREFLNVSTFSSVNGTQNFYNDFETSANSGDYGIVTGQNNDGAKTVYVTGENGNHYYRYENNGTKSGSKTAEMYYKLTGWGDNATSYKAGDIGGYDYAVIDFEMGTDKYVYKVNGTYHTASTLDEIPDNADPDSIDLAYIDGMAFNLHARASATAGSFSKCSEFYKDMLLYTVKDPETGDWYVGNGSTYAGSTAKIKLANDIGVFDHITYAVKTVRKAKIDSANPDLASSEFYVFINGEYLTGGPMGTKEVYEVVNLAWMRFSLSKEQYNDRYAICLDNFAINWYDQGYVSEGYGIDDYIKNGDYALNKHLYICDEIVYDTSYSFVGSPTAAELVHEDGSSDKYSNVFAAKTNIQAGDFVHMYKNIDDFTPSSFDINNVTFVSHNGSTLSLSKEAQEFYKLQHTGDRYTIRLATGGITLNWYDGINEAPIKTQSIVPYVAPTNDSEKLKIFGKVMYDGNSATIQILDTSKPNLWLWDKDGDKVGDTPLASLFVAYSVEGLNKLLEAGINEVNIYPVYSTLSLMYSIETMASNGGEKPDFIVQNYDYKSFTDFDTLQNALKNIKSGEEVKVTLYSDYEMSEDAVITIPKGATVNFDLNGHKITSIASVFEVSEAATFNLYSTKQNASIDASAIITSNGIDACTVNIGTISGIEGANASNVSFSAQNVINLSGSSSDAANANKIVINLNGGKYISTSDDSILFPISEMDMVINVSDAEIETNYIAFSVYNQYNTSADINIVNSKIMAYSTIGTWTNSCKMYIEGSIVAGLNLKSAGITLGLYNLISATEFDANSIRTLSGATLALASAGKLLVADLECNVLTYDPSVDMASRPELFRNIVIKPVAWLTPSGELYATTYWVEGSEITIGDVSADKFGIDTTKQSNGWFTYAYNTWEAGESTTIGGVTYDIVYKPVATKIVQSLDKVYVSLGISDTFTYNIYIPTPEIEGAEIVFDYSVNELTGFFDKNGNPILAGVSKNVTVGDESGYTRLTGDIAVDAFTADTVVIKYMVNGVLLEKTVTVDIFEYADKVDAAYGCGTDESKLVHAMLQYKLEVYKSAMGDAASSAIILMVEDQLYCHGSSCKCGDVVYNAPEENVDYSAIASLVKGFAYTLELDGVGEEYASSYSFSIYFKKDSGVAEVSLTGAEFVKYETDAYIEYRCTIASSDLAEVIEFTVDGTTASYSLAKYIEETNSSFAKALYVISSAESQQ